MKRAFVCDHDQNVLYMVTFVLTGIGWEVFTSTEYDNIIEKVLELNPSVILIDNDIPKDGGVIVMQILKKHSAAKHIPVIFLTSNPNLLSLTEGAEANSYLSKPFAIKKLEEVVTQAYDEFNSNGQSESLSN